MKVNVCYTVPNKTNESSFGVLVNGEMELITVIFQKLTVTNATILMFIDPVGDNVYSKAFYNTDREFYELEAKIDSQDVAVVIHCKDKSRYVVFIDSEGEINKVVTE